MTTPQLDRWGQLMGQAEALCDQAGLAHQWDKLLRAYDRKLKALNQSRG